MMNRVIVFVTTMVMMAGQILAVEHWPQQRLEEDLLIRGTCIDDGIFNAEDAHDIPQWRRDAITEYRDFIAVGGWTTNQLIDALILATTNHLQSPSWPAQRDYVIALFAFKALSEINHPRSLSFVANICTNGVKDILGGGVAGMFRYSSFEPEVFDYMRKVCVMTNIYERWTANVAMDMENCFKDRPGYFTNAATNEFARYQYFVLNRVHTENVLLDCQLEEFIPAYSNSIQRLNAMRYVANTATNRDQAVWATNQVNRLSALPTNQLNNVSWLEE